MLEYQNAMALNDTTNWNSIKSYEFNRNATHVLICPNEAINYLEANIFDFCRGTGNPPFQQTSAALRAVEIGAEVKQKEQW